MTPTPTDPETPQTADPCREAFFDGVQLGRDAERKRGATRDAEVRALREAAQAVVDFYEVWHRGDDNGYEWWNVIDPLRASLSDTGETGS